jgi:hypothetical protein
MSETARMVDYFYTCVDDRPGEGYRLLARMKRREVNFLAFSAFPSGPGQVQLNFIPEKNEDLQNAAKELNVQLMGPKKAFMIQGDDEIGALAESFRRFYERDINIHAAHCVCDNRGGYGMVIWVSPLDYAEAAEALGINYKSDVSETSAEF